MLQEIGLEAAYIDPPSMLELGESAKVWEFRDKFRELAVSLNPLFVGTPDVKNTWEEVSLASPSRRLAVLGSNIGPAGAHGLHACDQGHQS